MTRHILPMNWSVASQFSNLHQELSTFNHCIAQICGAHNRARLCLHLSRGWVLQQRGSAGQQKYLSWKKIFLSIRKIYAVHEKYLQGGLQLLSLGPGCVQHGVVVHELLHTLGLWHEQSRLDRDNIYNIYIICNIYNIHTGTSTSLCTGTTSSRAWRISSPSIRLLNDFKIVNCLKSELEQLLARASRGLTATTWPASCTTASTPSPPTPCPPSRPGTGAGRRRGTWGRGGTSPRGTGTRLLCLSTIWTTLLCQVWTVYGCGAREHVTRDPGAVHCSAAGTSCLHSILSIAVFVVCLLPHVRVVNHVY